MNLFGLIPGAHTATGAIGVTAELWRLLLLVINYTGILGIWHWCLFHHLLGIARLVLHRL